MRRSRLEYLDAVSIATTFGVTEQEVLRAVHSYFDSIYNRARDLPLDNPARIYSPSAFSKYQFAYNIPYIGRIGMSYSRYLRWRANSSREVEQESRAKYRTAVTRADIEKMASDILEGRVPEKPEKKRGKEFYKRVWLVGEDGKRLARQVIKKKKDVQD